MLEKLVQEELRHGTEEAQRGADRRHPATDRSRTRQPQEHRPGLQRGRDQSTNLLPLAQGVRRAEAGTGTPAERVGEREWPSAAPSDRVVAGEAGAEGCGLGKLLSPERRRCAVQHAREHHRLSERRACRRLGQWRGTQRYRGATRHDEEALTRAIIRLASQYGRYGYRRIAALLRQIGWEVGKGPGQRIWRREGLRRAIPRPSAVEAPRTFLPLSRLHDAVSEQRRRIADEYQSQLDHRRPQAIHRQRAILSARFEQESHLHGR